MSWFDRLIVTTLPFVPRPLVGRFSRPYIAGATLDDAVRCVAGLNAGGLMATIDVLGEFITRPEEARRTAQDYEAVLAALDRHRLDGNISIKLTAIGLKLDKGLCFDLVSGLVAAARARGRFVRIDMEDSSCTDPTLEIYLALRRAGLENAGVVLQACLRRTEDDARRLAAMGANIRLCKGIYIEPPAISYRDPEAIRQNYGRILEILLRGGSYVGIATHDERLVRHAFGLIRELGLTRDQYEFQMLLGVTPGLRQRIVAAGHRLRVYVPFGEEWYAYSVRRLKENPQIAGHVLRGLLRRS